MSPLHLFNILSTWDSEQHLSAAVAEILIGISRAIFQKQKIMKSLVFIIFFKSVCRQRMRWPSALFISAILSVSRWKMLINRILVFLQLWNLNVISLRPNETHAFAQVGHLLCVHKGFMHDQSLGECLFMTILCKDAWLCRGIATEQ